MATPLTRVPILATTDAVRVDRRGVTGLLDAYADALAEVSTLRRACGQAGSQRTPSPRPVGGEVVSWDQGL